MDTLEPPSPGDLGPRAPTNPPLSLASRGGRLFVDSLGQWWSVYEHLAPPEQPLPSLVFESLGAMRRVRNFPGDWQSLPPGDLEALSWRY